MATRTEILLIDDVSGGPAVETYRLTWQGQRLRLDLNEKNSAAFEKAMTKWVQAAGPDTTDVVPRKVRRNSDGDRQKLAEIRTWALSQHMKVSPRGRISREVMDAYHKAH